MNYINIRISADTLNFDDINEKLQFDNAIFHKKGDCGEYKGEKFIFNEDIWQTKVEVSEDETVSLIEQLVKKMYGNKDFLRGLSDKSDFSLWLTIYSEEIQQNFRVNNNILKMMSEIGINFDVSIMNLEQFYG